MNTVTQSIERFASAVPQELVNQSGKVFYSGRSAFSSPSPLYVVGVNPGGDPEEFARETVGSHTASVLRRLPSDWSAYRDESWNGAAPGTYGMAPRILHLFKQLKLKPGAVPASNLIFVRSRRESLLKDRQSALADLCWPFHSLVIEKLGPRVILCLGSTAGTFVRKKLGANRQIGQIVEQNNRRWTSQSFESDRGTRVVVATHPSIADWSAKATDPSKLVIEAMQ